MTNDKKYNIHIASVKLKIEQKNHLTLRMISLISVYTMSMITSNMSRWWFNKNSYIKLWKRSYLYFFVNPLTLALKKTFTNNYSKFKTTQVSLTAWRCCILSIPAHLTNKYQNWISLPLIFTQYWIPNNKCSHTIYLRITLKCFGWDYKMHVS